MGADADLTRAVDRLQVAMANHARAQRKLERAELERARAVLDARTAGMTTAAIGRVLGTSHVRVVQLSRWAEEKGLASDTRPDQSATGNHHDTDQDCCRCGHARWQHGEGGCWLAVCPCRLFDCTGSTSHAKPDPNATARGAPEPTPVGVLLARALEVTAEQPDPSATGWEAECAEFGCHEEPDPSATTRPCARRGCRDAAIAGSRFCETHARY